MDTGSEWLVTVFLQRLSPNWSKSYGRCTNIVNILERDARDLELTDISGTDMIAFGTMAG